MATPREHVEEIRRSKFSIGAGEPNPLTEDLHQAVKNLSAELYAKDVHFLMELIQNAEDNEYREGVDPSLQFVITSKDITGTGATSTLLIFNNEKGFSRKNIESICSIGRSTKKNNRKRGYIGEKGIGFKSVFLITSQPYIFSNGYQIRFNESPCSKCNVGYIVPEWVEENPISLEIKHIYGSNSDLPTTTIVLPLKPDKVKPVKQQLSSIHPELLLFLSKIKRLSVREDTEDPSCNTVTAISISSETNFITRKNIDAESFTLHLTADEKCDDFERECSYHMWRQRFPVRRENKVERRMEVEEWVITLAFPYGERLHRGSTSPGIYAFLPTEMVTNFPFIIQADFLLASSRETILLDCTWNQGILNCVPSAFVNAFTSLVKAREDAPVSLLPRMFGFLPVVSSPYDLLNSVRVSIQSKLMEESIIPCESYTEQKFFHKPREVGRLMPAFWNLLKMAREQGVSLDNISTHGKNILSSAFDEEKYDHLLNFLGVDYVNDEWYAKCIRSSNLVLGVSEDLYLELLLFIAENWRSFSNTSIVDIPLLKYAGAQSQMSLCRINVVPLGREILLSNKFDQISWLIDWNGEFHCANNRFFLPESTQCGILLHPKRQTIKDWLMKKVGVSSVSVYDYALLQSKVLGNERKCVVTYVHFLYHSFRKNYLTTKEVDYICGSMPLVNNYGQVITRRQGVLVPANGSCWVQLIGSNPWRNEGYVELGEDYLYSGKHAGVLTREKELLEFLKSHVAASDIPDLPPPDAQIPSLFSLLTKQNAFLLLEWIHNLKKKGIYMPSKFFNCIKKGSWLRVSLGGSVGCRPPSQSFLLASSWGCLLQNGSVLVDIPLIDQSFYGKEISDYTEELRKVGVMFEFSEACEYIGNHLMSIAASSTLNRGHVFSILNFIKFLRDKFLPPENFINKIKGERWLRTSLGDRSPLESVFYAEEWKAASQISDIPFIDRDYYGDEILSLQEELKLLGVVFGFCGNYKLVVDNLKSPSSFASLTAEAVLLLLECMRHLSSSEKLVRVLKDKIRLKTNMGYRSPAECYLFDPTWGCLLQVFNSFPLVDVQFYGEIILDFRNELKKIGVLVDFEEATKAFARVFRQQASLSSINKDNVLSLLACYKKLKGSNFKFPSDLMKCIQEVKWLRTRLTDCRAPKECILFSPDWMHISSISLLPFIDDGENYYGSGIHKYKEELKSMGVVVSFKNGAKFVASSLCLPQDPSSITAAAACSLLECIRNLPRETNEPLIATLSQKAAREWIKTHAGYRSPDKCLLFGSDWGSTLSREDGPFIDETFYGPSISSYSKELNALGVVVEKRKGCSLLACYLDTHADFMAIKRIYAYLNELNWKPTSEDAAKIWIPNGSNDGEWVCSDECVLHDKDGLFGQKLNVLDMHYEKKLLDFFSNALEVKTHPSLDDYCKLWKDWEDSGHLLSRDECISFWGFVAKHWSSVTQNVLSENFLKLPVLSGSDRILLMDKYDVFIADDLCLKDLFEQYASQSLFVWYPQPSLQSLPRKKLLDIYSKIGVRNLSASVQKSEQSAIDGIVPMQVNPKEVFIGKGLFKLILGFLADLQIEVQKRHDALKGLLEVNVLETPTAITVDYSLPLSSGEIMNVSARRLMRWERERSEFFMQTVDKSGSHKNVLERATYFSDVISEGLLWDKEDHIQQLAELIKLGFVVEFDEAAIGFLMKTKNLQIFLEDEEFLSSAFPCC
ncbi:DNA binding [Abeliophyllum distichum]|uniref:DNA binding n=1 Tax=Abeliophyllum distichum TaxID=126358 RepID=A0ABD1VTJ6_9LAMI